MSTNSCDIISHNFGMTLSISCAVRTGVMLSEPATVPESAILKRLWVHEVMRVYYDRLVEDSDRAWIVSFLKETMTKVFNTSFDELFKKLDFNNDGMKFMLSM